MFGQFASAQRSGELQDAGRATLGELRRGVAASAGLAPADARVTVGAVFAWSLAHGLSHLLLDGQIRDVGAEPAAIADAVLTFAARGMRRRT
jgi:hypothetical protein